MSQDLVESALVNALIDADLGLDFAWENRSFTPRNLVPWAKVHFEPDPSPQLATTGTQGEDEARSFFQIDLNYPINRSGSDIDEKVKTLQVLYGSGKSFEFGGQYVHVDSVGYTGGRTVSNFFRKTVRVIWWARIPRITA